MMEHGKPIIYVKNVRKVYRMGDEEVVALKRINLKIYKGEVCCIFGTSGSGKSTLLNQLAGITFFKNRALHSLTSFFLQAVIL